MGYDLYHMNQGNERAFISTYQDMGFIKNGKLIILSPQQKIKSFVPDFTTGANVGTNNVNMLINEAIAWYQGASYLYKTGKYSMAQ